MAVAGFRYAQFCPLARAAEIVGERWTLLVVRELLLGPKRFSDLTRPLSGVSSSVLADRLLRLEARGVVSRRALPPPAPATVYELTETGRALTPALLELARWGALFLEAPAAGEHIEPAWLRLGLPTFARRGPSPRLRFNVAVPDGQREIALHVAGGPAGTVVRDGAAEADASIRAEAGVVLALAAGRLAPREAIRSGALRAEGEVEALADFPDLFDLQPPTQKGN
jgi:DNA-binding HxlR family transcriptional regulator